MPNVWIRPPNQRREADAAKALLTVPDGDHLTLLNVWNEYSLSTPLGPPSLLITAQPNITTQDKHNKNWTYTNYLNARALAQADNVRSQLQRTMERFDVELISIQDQGKLYMHVRQALVCGFFMQVAHKEGEKGNYLTVKDNQACLFVFSSFGKSV